MEQRREYRFRNRAIMEGKPAFVVDKSNRLASTTLFGDASPGSNRGFDFNRMLLIICGILT
jgi:hypothetical protein